MGNNGFSFVIGMAAGFVVGYICARSIGDKNKKEELESLERYYKEKAEKIEKPISDMEKEIEKVNKKVKDIITDQGYDPGPFEEVEPLEHIEQGSKEGPYVIPGEWFGEYEDYEQICLSYYENGVLVDDDEILDNIEIDDTVGLDFAEHFGEYENDAVYIRNDEKHCDYEILKTIGVFVESSPD